MGPRRFLSPRSYLPIEKTEQPTFAASSSCVSPASTRAWISRSGFAYVDTVAKGNLGCQYRMSTSSTRSESPQTSLRKLRRLLVECMEGSAPPICARIRETRERLKEDGKRRGGHAAAKEFSQEQVAHRVGVSLKAYRAYESTREPGYERRRAIARALGLNEDHFETERPEEERLRQIVQEELVDVREAVERIEKILAERDETGDRPKRPRRRRESA